MPCLTHANVIPIVKAIPIAIHFPKGESYDDRRVQEDYQNGGW